MKILGINAYHPDSSAALLVNGKIVAACEEERFRRIKHFSGFPAEAIKSCLKQANIAAEDIDYIAIPRQNKARLLKKIQYGIKIPSLVKKRLKAWRKTENIESALCRSLGVKSNGLKAKVIRVEHHRAHLASSFFTSGFKEAFLLSCDALGDFASTMWGEGKKNEIKIEGEIAFPHSLGFFYTALSQYLGFLKFGDEYKVMGLASYGKPVYRGEFKNILILTKSGFKLNLKYFLHHKKYIDMNFADGCPDIGLMFSSYLEKRLGKRRLPAGSLQERHKHIAASLQKRLEEAVIHLLNLHSGEKYSNLCLSGGVAFNCAANGKILEESSFKNIYVPPAPGDAGLALGAALFLWQQLSEKKGTSFFNHAYLGPGYSQSIIGRKLEEKKTELDAKQCIIKKINNETQLCKKIAESLSCGKIIGWFQGGMEFGPRALGNRSILADPRREEIKDVLNQRIKHREAFRPFAPSVLEEYLDQYFEKSCPSPFMSFVDKIKEEKRGQIPAVCHIDGTARLQTVNKKDNPLYWRLINEFYKITKTPLVLNTSFNENEPIVNSPKEAIDCFLRTQMGILVLGNTIIERPE